ncbi:MAG: 30S ribosomal protein S4 [Nanoarchaeota archaeon]|nr:30S ribosomal protein S4 [Nanoarchaeota archaeon]
MGDPKKPKKKYFTPRHPWVKERIDQEKELTREFALKNKKEIYKIDSVLKKFKDRAKNLISATTKQGEKEKKQLLQRLHKLGLVSPEAALDDVLSLNLKDIMDRRLQNMVTKKALARTQAQARQFIVHQHIMIKGKKVTAPNYLVTRAEEDSIQFTPKSKLANQDHPERSIEEKMPVRPAPTEEEKKQAGKTEKKKEAKKPVKKETKKKPAKKKETKTEKKKEPKKTEKKEAPKEEKKEDKK